jgi:class 3 adenylate cyclase/tetratricopeptide (TPR) repeat protein
MARQAPGGVERRQLTVLFCDYVESTALTSEMDVEDLHFFMTDFVQFCADVVKASGGEVARFQGDGVLGYFCYSEAREDAAQLAVHAGLRLCEAGLHLPKPTGPPIAVRVGIATGLVIVGDWIKSGATQERMISGLPPILAARLQSIAEPNTVVVSDPTKRITDGVFDFRPVGPFDLKGLASPVFAWTPIGQRRVVSRFAGRRSAGISPLIGRELELADIWKSWREARNGVGHIVGVVGEAGIGKSRLIEEARETICRDGKVTWLEGSGTSILDQTPFHVVTQFIPALAAASQCSAADLNHARDILGGEPDFDDGGADASAKRRELLSLLRQWIDAAARDGPIVLAVEDLHWADPSSLELFDQLVTDPRSPLLFLYTSREDFTDRWPSGPLHRVSALSSLPDTASAELARTASGGRLGAAQVRTIVSLAEGVPLFVEELARLMAARGGAPAESAIPSTLADLLTARLEQLGPAKRSAQIAAVLGPEFSDDLFASMVEIDRLDARSALAALEKHAVVVPGKTNIPGHHAFRHALFATAAYDTLLKGQRRELHGRAASLIVERFPGLEHTQPQVLARHWAGAGDTEKAAAAWGKAGDTAKSRHAFQEAEHAYREALAAIDSGTTLAERDRTALGINAKLNSVLQITQGYSASEASRISERVHELAVKVGDVQLLSRQKSVKWRAVFTAGDYAQAERLVDEVLELSQAEGDALWRRTFHLRAGIQLGYYTGRLAHGERSFLAWSAIDDGSHRGVGDDALSMGIAALIAHMTGRQAVAEQRIESAFAIAELRGAPYDRAMALHTQSCLHQFSREVDRLAESATRLTDLAAQSGFEYAGWLALGWVGITNIHGGNASLAVEQIGSAVAAFERLGARVSMVFWLRALGWAHHMTGEHEKALKAYHDAMAFNRQERAFRPEAYIGRADLLSAMERFEDAERDLRGCARLAAAMGAKSYRLRSLVSLARLYRSRGDDAALRRVLPSIDALLQPGYCAADRDDVAALAREAGHALDLGRMAAEDVRP